MALIADFLLLAASACACFYCWMLSKRLQKLKNTRRGIAASVASLSKSVDEAKKAIAHSHVAAEESVQKLSPLVAEAKQLSAELKTMAKVLNEAQFAPVPEPVPEPVPDTAPKNSPKLEATEPPVEQKNLSPDPVIETVPDNTPSAEQELQTQEPVAEPKKKPSLENVLDEDGDEDEEGFEIEWKADEETSSSSDGDDDIETVVLDDTEEDDADDLSTDLAETVQEGVDSSLGDDPILNNSKLTDKKPPKDANRDVISLKQAS